MKNKINKIVSLLMVFFLTFSLFAPLANARIEDGEKGSITIKKVNEEVNITAYRLAKVNYDFDKNEPTTPVYEWVDALQSWMDNNYPDYSDAEDFREGIVGTDKEDGTKYPTADEVYDAIAAAIRTGADLTLEAAGQTTGKVDGDVTIGGLEMGNYLLVIENGLRVYKPAAVNVVPQWDDTKNEWVMHNPTTVVDVKSTGVGIRKNIVSVNGDTDINTVSIGDTVQYTLEVDVPYYPVNSKNKTFIVSDEITNKLEINYDKIEVYGRYGTDVVKINEDLYEVKRSVTLNTDGGKTVDFQIVFDYDELRYDESEAKRAYEELLIDYEAFVTTDVEIGQVGNKNTGYLEYSINPYSYDDEVRMASDEVNVYSYGIILNKVGEKGEAKDGLPGAIFTLSDEKSGETERNDFRFIKTGDGEYRLALDDEEDVVTEITGDSEKGILKVRGLKAGTYYFKEVKAPGSYNRLKTDVEITIYDEENDVRDGVVEEVKVNADGNKVYVSTDNGHLGYAEVTVENKKGFTLPETGGIGTIIFTVVGIVLMGVGVMFFKRHSLKENI